MTSIKKYIKKIMDGIRVKQSKLATSTKLYKKVSILYSNIGSYTYIGPETKIFLCDIGNYCSVGPKCLIGLGIHPLNLASTSPYFYSDNHNIEENKKIKIGNDVWIGAKVLINDGVEIGNGAIVAAGAVVTKNIPSYEIWGGVPAKKIRSRYKSDIKEKLESLKWWDIEIKSLDKSLFNLDMNDEKNFLLFEEKIREIKTTLLDKS